MEKQNIIAFKNLINGSIDWRGTHELSTIYSDDYYLKNKEIWKPIYNINEL